MDLNTLLNEFIDSINQEIQTRKQKAKQRPFLIKDGEKTSSDPNGTIYRFNDFSYNVIPESMRLINVAATRAISKLIVIANVDFIEQKLRDNKKAILYQWIQYLRTQKHVYLNTNSDLKYSM